MKSLKIGLYNYVILFFVIIAFMSPLGSKPGSMHPLLVIPIIFFFVSIILSIIGIKKWFYEKNDRKLVALFLNVIYLLLTLLFLVFLFIGGQGV